MGSDRPSSWLTPSVIAAGVFTLAYLLAAVAGALATGNHEFIFYIAVMVVLIAAVLVLHRRVRLSDGAFWCLAVWGALHMAGGLVPVPASWPIAGEIRVLYSWWIVPRAGGEGWLKYDQVVHAYGFGVTTWVCWQALVGAMREVAPGGLRPTVGRLVLVGAAGVGFGALNEVVEFAATRMTETNVGGYVNTGWDLVFNTLGAAIAVTLIARAGGPDRTPPAEGRSA